ncbi:unnamed protein product [Lactuca saligna]|uniref:Uncharacterized protein n=1 Tax=Lactuca saligna TaxID=75948 RepID=A0AA35ZD89_LACSI|nr:unnamed protein product [Lactuca saligna]
MADGVSWTPTSSLEEEHIVLDDLVDTLDYVNDLKPNYTPVEHPTEPSLSLYYTLARLVLLSSEYKPNEDEEDTATSAETSPPRSLLHTSRIGHPQESSTTPPPTLDTPVEHVISLLEPCTTHHSDRIGAMDSELFLLRIVVMQLMERVQYLEEESQLVQLMTLLIVYCCSQFPSIFGPSMVAKRDMDTFLLG